MRSPSHLELSIAASTPKGQFLFDSVHGIQEIELKWYQKPTVRIFAGCVLGFGAGVILGRNNASTELVSWIALPGTLFLRALTCIVMPLIFVNVFLSVVEMLAAGKATRAGLQTLGLFVLTTFFAVGTGLLFVGLFQNSFVVAKSSQNSKLSTLSSVKIGCGNTSLLHTFLNGTVSCLDETIVSGSTMQFTIANTSSTTTVKMSLSDTIQEQIFKAIVPDNIVAQFVAGNFIGIMAFAIFLAISMQRVQRSCATVLAFCKELNEILLACIGNVILCTPIAVASLVAGGLGTTNDFTAVFGNVGIFLVAFGLAIIVHGLGTLGVLYYLIVSRNTKKATSWKEFFPVHFFAFGCASSAATIPITLDTAVKTNVPSSIAGFVVTLGATLHMNGTAIYFPCAVVYVICASGLQEHLDPVAYLLLCILSVVSAAATAPVPSGALVLVLPMVNTVCGDTSSTTAVAFSYLLAMDFVVDRFRTVLNVHADLVVGHCVTSWNKELIERNSESRVQDSV
ncbi:hypothetical protein THRCLA_01240 [Thraustotheca clavata]|uniref:Amino acid transporter n=1 Tax=Thraustotheca clavata TaxID=74557 RepID=A0A1W0A8V6_9STRA|nr:hypothetical protein THRCLA_01240 [Thraustotheca clavata]